MTAPQDAIIADLRRTIAELRQERDAALTQRNSAYDERIEHQSATIDVLKAMSASPGDPQPVFDLIVRRAHELCGSPNVGLTEYDGALVHLRSMVALEGDPEAMARWKRGFPRAPSPGPSGAVYRDGQDVHIRDNRAEPGVDANISAGSMGSTVGLPLLHGGKVVGAMFLGKLERGGYSDSQIALLKTFAEQAAIAIGSAATYRALRDRTAELTARDADNRALIARQAASVEVLKAITASPDDPLPVLDLIIRRAGALVNAQGGNLVEYDGTLMHQRASFGYEPETWARLLATFPRPPGPETMPGRAVLSGKVVHVPDAQADLGIFAPGRALGARAFLNVPLLREGRVVGVIAFARFDPGAFDQSAIELVQSFAEQAVIALGSAAALRELRQRTADLQESLEQQTATAEVLQVINASPGNLTPVFDAMLEKAMRLCGAAFGILRSIDEHGTHAFLATRGVPTAYAEHSAQIPFSVSPLGRLAQALETGRPVQTLDIKDGEGYRSGQPNMRAIADLGGARTILHVPLIKDLRAVGYFTVYRQEVREFSDKEIALLENFAAQAVIAIDNARLLAEIRTARDNAEATLRELKTAQANLIQAEKMASLGQLTAGIAHEIKNPLNFVNNFALLSVELLAELKETIAKAAASLDDGQRADIEEVAGMLTGNLERIAEHGKRADGIVRAMLEHSRGASGERRTVDINALVDEALNLAYHGARAQDQSFNIALERDFGDGIAPIELNPQDITRVFLNLFSNGFYAAAKRARDSASPGLQPTLAVATRGLGDRVEIRVRDNGIGIPEDIRDKLFEPFFTTKPSGEGTGLGLSITYDIVTKQHGGTIAVDSEVGERTEFVITLPRKMFVREAGRG